MKKKSMGIVNIFLIGCMLALLPVSVYAFPIAQTGEGLSIYVNSTNDIIATYEGNSAAYSNDLYLQNNDSFIFNNHATPVGTQVNLGSFSLGTELIFRLHVNNTGYDFYTGPADRNPDNHFHARVDNDWAPNISLVSFEDLLNGPFVYNDLSFSFTNTIGSIEPPPVTNPIPEPSTFLLLGGGLAGLAFYARRRRKV